MNTKEEMEKETEIDEYSSPSEWSWYVAAAPLWAMLITGIIYLIFTN